MAVITHVYDTYAHAQRVVTDLEASGIPSSEISIVANKYVSEKYADVDDASAAGTGAGIGAALGGGAGLLAGLGLLATTALGAAAGAATGGIIGALVGVGVSEDDAHVYAESVRRGGTMVTVRTDDANRSRAESIMSRYSPIDPATRRDAYRKEGWQTFDPNAPPYRPTDAEIERIRRTEV
jgi:uncharacterized membrane protein